MLFPSLSSFAACSVLAFAGLAMSAAPAMAATRADNQQPTLVDADSLSYDDLKQTSVFTGNVVLTRGSLSLRADRLELREDPEGFQMGVATASGNNQVFVRQRREGTDEFIEGTAQRAEFDGRNDRIHFISRAVVKRLECEQVVDEVRGERITYDQRSETYSATGGPRAATPNQRVRTVIQPREGGGAGGQAAPAGCARPAPVPPKGKTQ